PGTQPAIGRETPLANTGQARDSDRSALKRGGPGWANVGCGSAMPSYGRTKVPRRARTVVAICIDPAALTGNGTDPCAEGLNRDRQRQARPADSQWSGDAIHEASARLWHASGLPVPAIISGIVCFGLFQYGI